MSKDVRGSSSTVPAESDEQQSTKVPLAPRRDRKGIYLLPNLFTTAALFSGFYAVVAAMNGDFDNAAIAIFVAMVMDGLDGRVARMTNTQSDFGAEYDSLADMVSFGVAPALVAFSWALQSLGKVGWVCAFIYCAGAALRLARFNTQLTSSDKNFFTGLASPSAAAIIYFSRVNRHHDEHHHNSQHGNKGDFVAQIEAFKAVITEVTDHQQSGDRHHQRHPPGHIRAGH